MDFHQATTESGRHAVPPAVSRAAKWLGLSNEQLDQLFLAHVHSHASSDGVVDAQASAESPVVQIQRHLRPILGSPLLARRWMRGHNLALDARPVDLLFEPNGTERIVEYLARFGPR
jgi:hypothetical protein